MNGSISRAGIPAAIVTMKKVGHQVASAIPPDGAVRMSRLAATRLDSRANCVAENRLLHIIIMNASSAAVARPAMKFSTMITPRSQGRFCSMIESA